MKRSQVGTVAFSMIFAVLGVANQGQTFRGEIMDSFCAEAGSHEAITNGPNAKECTIDCVKFGAEYVLSAGRSKSYRLDDQRTPALFAGETVSILGTYDGETNTIHVMAIQPTLSTSLKRFSSLVRAYFSQRA